MKLDRAALDERLWLSLIDYYQQIAIMQLHFQNESLVWELDSLRYAVFNLSIYKYAKDKQITTVDLFPQYPLPR